MATCNIRTIIFKFRGTVRLFGRDDYSHYQGGLSASYFASLFGRPFLLSADVSVDGWNEGWGKLQGRFVAAMIFKRGNKTGISVGLAAMTLGKIPVMPVFSYWHRFDNPDWSVDITLPSQLYLRYQIKNQRISVGSSMTGDNFYLHTDLSELPSVCYYSEVVIKPEVLYEYIINKHFLSFGPNRNFRSFEKWTLYKRQERNKTGRRTFRTKPFADTVLPCGNLV